MGQEIGKNVGPGRNDLELTKAGARGRIGNFHQGRTIVWVILSHHRLGSSRELANEHSNEKICSSICKGKPLKCLTSLLFHCNSKLVNSGWTCSVYHLSCLT